jgi:hypothetical protein
LPVSSSKTIRDDELLLGFMDSLAWAWSYLYNQIIWNEFILDLGWIVKNIANKCVLLNVLFFKRKYWSREDVLVLMDTTLKKYRSKYYSPHFFFLSLANSKINYLVTSKKKRREYLTRCHSYQRRNRLIFHIRGSSTVVCIYENGILILCALFVYNRKLEHFLKVNAASVWQDKQELFPFPNL